MGAADPFRPLEPGEVHGVGRETGPADDPFVPTPPPADTEPPAAHPTLGRYVGRWPYRGPDGALQGFVCRFDRPDGSKTFRPLRHGVWRGRERWCWTGWGQHRPLYRLVELLARPGAPALVVEGERKADAAASLFPDHVAVAPMCGAKSPGRTAWAPLRGRHVTVWPDRDEPGQGFAAEVAGLLHVAGAASVRVVAVPEAWPEGWDLADEPPSGATLADLRATLEAAPSHRPPFSEQPPFRLVHARHRAPARGQALEPGLYRLSGAKGGDGGSEETWVRVGSVVEVLADSRTAQGDGWGRLLRVVDRDGTEHRWAMPMELLAGDGADVRRALLRLGFEPAPGPRARMALEEYLTVWRPAGKVRCVDRVGWHGDVFVLPDRTMGRTSEPVVLQTAAPPKLGRAGTLEGWRGEVAALASGNTRLTFALSLPFAGPLLRLVGEESGGFTEVGGSSIGKTTLLAAAASVTGGEVGSWRAILYASGEVGLAAKLGEAGKRPRAGQEVRLVDLRADAGWGLGVFEELHGHADGDALSRRLKRAAQEQRGTALLDFLEALTANVAQARALVLEDRERLAGRVCPAGADGQVRRVAGRFGLVAAAGELASRFRVTGWPPDLALDAAERRFKAWLEDRGGCGSAEDRKALAQVRLFLELHGLARFEPAWAHEQEAAAAAQQLREARVAHRAGFRRLGADGRWTYLVLPEVWRSEVCSGQDPARVARLLLARGFLKRGEGKNLAVKERVPGIGPVRAYAVLPAILADGA